MDAYFTRLRSIQKDSRDRGVPNVSWENGYALFVLTQCLRPERILEIGTANGVSTLFFAKALEAWGGTLDTIERSSRDLKEATGYFAEMGMGEIITTHEGDAISLLPTLEGPFDLIFIDAMKREYVSYAQLAMPHVSDRGIMIFDDVVRYRHKMEDLFAWITQEGYHHIVLPTDADDGILVLIPRVHPEL